MSERSTSTLRRRTHQPEPQARFARRQATMGLQDSGHSFVLDLAAIPRFAADKLAALAGKSWAVGIAGLVLVWPAFWNGYPLVFADSGTYLGQALLGRASWDRPLFYSLFLHATHWRLSLWPTIFAQGLLVAHVLYLSLRAVRLPGAMPLLVAACCLAVLTRLPFFAGQIMPDFFTGIVVLTLWLLGFRFHILSRGERVYVALLATISIAVHLSHLPLALAVAVAGGCTRWILDDLSAGIRSAARMAAPALPVVLAL